MTSVRQRARVLWARRSVRRAALAVTAVLLLGGIALAASDADIYPLKTSRIEISARPIASFDKSAPERRRFGKLEFRGGLELTSASKSFGGWSGIVLDTEGRRLVAISDEGLWLEADISYDGTRPAKLGNARVGPLLGPGGTRLKGKHDRDAEAMALASGTVRTGTLLVAFERKHRIARFDIDADGLSATKSFVGLPPEAKRMGRNSGLEAVTVLKGGPYKGSILAFSERLTDPSGNLIGWLWVNGKPQHLAVTDVAGFDLTDAAALSDGSVLLLERRFRWTEGVKMRLRRLPAAELKPGAVIAGDILIEADLRQEIDNMEGLAVHRGPRGETVVTMISDDNFNHLLQRTLLLQFTLQDAGLANVND